MSRAKTGRGMYSVVIPITGVCYAEVEADSEGEAIDKVLSGEAGDLKIESWECHKIIAQGNYCHAEQNEASAEFVSEIDE